MIEASKLRAGMTFEAEGKLIKVLEASHHKPGKGNTIMRMKLRDVRTGSTFDTTYRPDEKFEQAIIETVPAQYLYQMDDTAYFMNTETYDQVSLPRTQLGDENIRFLKENMNIQVMVYGEETIGIELPNTVVLKVVETEPGVKGDTASNVTKAATMETGAVIRVPLFVNEGDELVIDTRNGEYVSRN